MHVQWMSINNVAVSFRLEGVLDAARVLETLLFILTSLAYSRAIWLRAFLSRVSCCVFAYGLLSVYFEISL